MSKYLGIDYGTANIGFAFSSGELVSPLEAKVFRQNHQIEIDVIDHICKTVIKENIDTIVIGSPLSFQSDLNTKITEFIKKLENEIIKRNISVQIKVVDEKNSSSLSVDEMIRYGISKSKRSNDHSFAAARILADYLNQI